MSEGEFYTSSSIDMGFSNVTNGSVDDAGPISTHVVKPWFNGVLVGGYLVILIIGILANGMVMMITLADQRKNNTNTAVRTINTYIINLASADFLYTFDGIFWAIVNYNQRGWLFGQLGCRIVMSMDVICMHCSSYILTVMTIERYLVIMNPMRSVRFRNFNFARKISIFIWLSGLGLSLPVIIGVRETAILHGGKKFMICGGDFIFGAKFLNRYYMSVYAIAFAIPSVLMVCIYSRTFSRICSNMSTIEAGSEATKQLKHSTIRAARIVFLIVMTYWFCYTPFWIDQILTRYAPHVMAKRWQVVGLTTLLLTYLNSMVNPFIYTLMPKRYNVWKKLRSKNKPRKKRLCHARVAMVKQQAFR